MKSKIYCSIVALSIFIIGFSIYYGQKSINQITNQKIKDVYNTRIKEYKVFYDTKKTFLDSFAKFLSNSETVLQAYHTDNRKMLINYVKPLYDNLHKTNIIEELHFFKRPAISFVNFDDLNKYNFSVAKARADITWIDTSFQPSTHFYICRLYPGLRATYPIIDKDKLLGSISFGININQFKKLFEQVGASNVSIYINNTILKKMLLPTRYAAYKNLPTYKDYKVLGKVFKNISLKKGYEFYNNNVYTKIKIIDFFGHTMGYLVIDDNISKSVITLNRIFKEKIGIEIFGFLIVFTIIFILFKWIFDKMNEMNNILSLIKSQQFSKIPPKNEPKDEFDIYKNNLIEVAENIKTYISLLHKEVEEYSNKAYRDGLTNVLNRRFLEEKANEIFVKFKVTDTPLGVIMMDIDNFKNINDTYGHNIGDLVLTTLTDSIKKDIRQKDLFIRYGGEEFLLILPNSNIKNTYKIAEKIRKDIEKLEINIGSKHIKFTISLGVSEIDSLDENLYTAIKRADINLYKAKQNGKNRVEI